MLRRALVLALALAGAVRSAAAAEIGYVYVRANVGGASGGHAAFVSDGTVYHLQTESGDLFRMVRDGWAHFEYMYAALQNRPLEIAHVEVSDAARDAIVDRFARVYVAQDLDYARRDERALDVAWLEAWRDGTPLPPLRAAGLLDPRRTGDPDMRALAARLRARVRDTAFAAPPPAAPADDLVGLRERLALREALAALDEARGLDPDALVALPDAYDDPLGPQERAALEALAQRLETAAAELLESQRPDRGYALLVTEARLLALRRSLAENRLRVVDALDGVAPAPGVALADDSTAAGRARQAAYVAHVLRQGRSVVLVPGKIDESRYNLIEEAAALLERAASDDPRATLVELTRQQPPVRGRSLPVAPPDVDLDAALAVARERLAAADARLHERWSYDLVRRNCITELSDVTAAAFPSQAEADAALGGRVPAGETLGFIPFVFFDRVSERLRVTRVERIPGERERELAALTAAAPGVWARARESIAPLSHVYTPRQRDGAFLLFTDDVFWRRPLYGAANLIYGLGYAATGVLTLPFDRGARARAGLSGAFWSVPELAFQNVRKGTFEFVERD